MWQLHALYHAAIATLLRRRDSAHINARHMVGAAVHDPNGVEPERDPVGRVWNVDARNELKAADRCIALDNCQRSLFVAAMPEKLFTPRLGLCCTFANEPQLKFRTTTVAHLSRLVSGDTTGAFAYSFYETLVRDNLTTLEDVVRWCHRNDIHAFRINSDLWPRATHPLVQPWVEQLFLNESIQTQCKRIRIEAERAAIRLSEHPDQFLVGNSLRADVVDNTIAELEWRGRLGDALGLDVICLHVGSGAPDRESALWRWDQTLARLSPRVLSKLAFENDDRTFSPERLLPACLHWGLPMIYDVHHHRALPDSLSVEEATEFTMASWGNREPYFHLSSPRAGWQGGDARPHHDYIDVNDWPSAWSELWNAGVAFTVDIEAKAKELAVFGLRSALVA